MKNKNKTKKTVESKVSKLKKQKNASVEPVIVTSRAKNILSSAQKARLVADLIRGKNVEDAVEILKYTQKKVAKIIFKVLKSAIANAENNYNLDPELLVVSKILINDGMKLPRYRFASRGRVVKILKRRAHVLIELSRNR